MIKNYAYDGTLKQKAAKNRENKQNTNVYNEFDNVLQNNDNILKNDPDARHEAAMALGDPESADIRIVGLGHSGTGNSSLMLRLFYNEYDNEPEDNKLLQWEQHQMNYKYLNNDILRISYFDLKGFDDILSQSEMSDRIASVINHSFNVILLYYSIDNKISFSDDINNGYSVQNIKTYVEHYLSLIDHLKFVIILVGLKSDLDDRKISGTQGQNLAQEWGNIPFIEISAKTGENVGKLLEMICKIYTNSYETVDGDLYEAAAFDEDKQIQKIIIAETDEYDDDNDQKQKTPNGQSQIFQSFDEIIVTNDDGIDEDSDDDDDDDNVENQSDNQDESNDENDNKYEEKLDEPMEQITKKDNDNNDNDNDNDTSDSDSDNDNEVKKK
eukprot:542430_1